MSLFIIAWRNLVGERGRLLITTCGVAFSVALILTLLGLYLGWQAQMTRFLGTSTAELWVAQKGSRDMSHSLSLIPVEVWPALRQMEGVDRIVPLAGRQVTFDLNDKEAHLYLVGVDENQAVKPYKLLEGNGSPQVGEVVVDQSFAKSERVRVGDTLNIKNTRLQVVGIMDGGNLMVYTYALANLADVEQILGLKDYVNYYLVTTNDVLGVQQQIEDQFPDLSALERQTFLDYNAALLKDTFLPIVEVLLVIALLIGLAVIGLTIYTATIEKSREYGVLKAIGYTNFQLILIAWFQSLAAGIIGYLLGGLLTKGVVALATRFTSSFIYELSSRQLFGIFWLTVAMATVSALIPLRRIIGIDPARVFKA